MAHELSFINGIAEFAYLTGTPVWHGFGQAIPEDQAHNIDAWLYASNMGNWSIKTAPVLAYDADADELISFDGRKLLYRSDTKQPLADVGYGYNVVQPAEVVRFFEQLIDTMGFKMITCGCLFGGRKFWAQADIGSPVSILGQERVEGKLLLATSCDGSMKTRAQYTTTAVVCNNTLRMATASDSNSVELSHSGVFNADQVKEALELKPEAMLKWQKLAEQMTSIKINQKQAGDFFDKIFNGQLPLPEDGGLVLPEQLDLMIAERSNTHIDTCLNLFSGAGTGMHLAGRDHTLWGAVNSVTEYIDHWRKTKTMDARIDRAWFGDGANFKDQAWDEAVLMAA